MEIKKKQAMIHTYREFVKIGLNSNDPGPLPKIIDENLFGFGTTIDEKIKGIEGVLNLIENQKAQGQGLDISWRAEPVTHYTTEDENTAVFADDVYLTIKAGEEAVEMYLRVSVVLNYQGKQWKVIHFHTSKPEQVESEKDTWGLDSWKQKAEELERLVAEKTADLVEKNRELEIEAAIERVRTQSMAMHHPDDLDKVNKEILNQLNGLRVPGLTGVTFYLINKDGWVNAWDFSSPGNIGAPNSYTLQYDFNKYEMMGEPFRVLLQSDQDYYVADYTLEKLKKAVYELEEIIPATANVFKEALASGILTHQWSACARISSGLLGIDLVNPPSEDTKSIVLKMAGAFNQAYTRFLDLQKAEAQAREAKIEAALERVRSKSLSIHKSSELREVVNTLYGEFTNLEVKFDNVVIQLIKDKTKDLYLWISTADGLYDDIIHWPYVNMRNFNEMYAASTTQSPLAITLNQEETNTFFDEYFKVPGVPPGRKEATKAVRQIDLIGHYQQHTGILLMRYAEGVYSDHEKDITHRFSKVFEQTYTRFLDLQKAEAQAREAQIQLSLERVRARSMAMQSSEELSDVLSILFQQFDVLGIKPLNVWLSLYNLEENIFTYRATGTGGTRIQGQQVIDINAMDIWKDSVEQWKSGHADPVLVTFYPPEVLPQLMEVFKETFDAMPEVERMDPKLFPEGGYNVQGYTKFGYIGYNHLKPPTQEEKDILQKFATEFERVYQRFLDVEKAEAQAREAQIQLSLERVRAKAMAMRQSEELTEVLPIIFEQLDGLGVKTVWTHLTLMDLEKNTFTYRMTGREGKRVFAEQIVDMDASEIWQNAVEAFKAEEPDSVVSFYFPPSSLPDIWETFDGIFSTLPVGYQIYPEDFSGGIYTTQANCEFGYIGINNTEKATQEEENILLRFAKEFGRLYRRFLDLQNAEAQARDARIETALERVRARSMAMHQTDELNDVLCVLLEQFDFLGINPVLTHLTLFDEANEKFSLRLTTSPTSRILVEQIIDIYAVESWKASYENWKKGIPNTVDCIEYPPEALPAVWEVLSEVMNALPEGHKINPEDFPNGLFTTQGHFKFGYLGFNHRRKATAEEKTLVSRFATEFGRAYQRFLDIQKAEAQAREALIEAALERVRSKSMGIQNTTEMQQVANETRKQLLSLGLKIDALAMSGVIDNEADYDVWVGGAISEKPLRIAYNNDTQVQRDYNNVIKERPELFMKTYSGKIMKEYFKQLMDTNSFNPEIEKFMKECSAFTTTLTFMKNSGIQIIRYTAEPFSNSDNQIVIRFGKVFEQAYIRFLDLQKAEAQAREARIEAALEKVRSRTMGMQSSSELPEVANLLFLEVQGLGVPSWSSGFNVLLEDKKSANAWMSSEGTIQEPFVLRLWGEASFDEMGGFIKSKETFMVQELGGNALVEHYNYMKSFPDLQPTFEKLEIQGLSLPTYQINHLCKFSNGFLLFITYEQVPEAYNIFKRFTKVFEQTYTRFLDLQKAEAQAREAQIETALERVRAQAMAMHHTEDLGKTIQMYYEQLDELIDSTIVRCGAGLLNKENTIAEMSTASKSPEGVTYQVRGTIDMKGHPMLESTYEHWLKQKEYSHVLRGNEIREYYQYISNQVAMPENYGKDELYFYFPMFSEGSFYMVANKEVPESELKIFRRFSSVLSLTYKRFNDLQKAEAQARESQVEAALERVRAQTMAMHNSEDVGKCVVRMFSELTALGVDEGTRFGIGILNHDNENNQLWTARKNGEEVNLHIGKIDMTSHPLLKSARKAWKEKVPFHKYVLEGEDLLNYYQMLNKAPNYKIQIPIEKLPKKEIQHCFIFEHGFFYAFSPVEFQPELIHITKRFSVLFEQTYRRYLDLVKAEAQAREAIKRASVDRVRGEIASMRTTSDLERIQPLIWNELKILGVPFIRCGVFIMDQTKQEVQAFLSTPDGASIAAFHLPYRATEQTRQIVSHWEQKQSYRDHMDEAAFSEFTRNLVEQGAMASTEKYVTANRPTDLYLHFLPFLQGMLYVGNDAPLKDEELQLVQNLAEAFSTAYARYEDFNKLELAKSAVEAAMSELKATQAQLVQQEKLASLGQLTAGIAHEIKNPLNFVNNFSEVSMEMIEEIKEERAKNQESRDETLVDEILDDIQSNLGKIHEHGSRANGIVTSMLQHSRGGSGKKEPTDLNALIKEYVNLSFHGMRAGKNPIDVEIVLDLDESIGKVSLIGEDFSRVILNLCNNAFDAMRQKTLQGFGTLGGLDLYHPKLTVRTKSENDQILISVEDNGPGIPDEIKDKILQPFFTTKKGTEGTGLGLSITHDIVKAHGGEIEIETSVNIGTKFIIKLPIV